MPDHPYLQWPVFRRSVVAAFQRSLTQNRDTRALQLKLDELIRSTAGARPQLIQLEELDDDQLAALKQEFERVRERRSRSTG
jgi:low affinity Fe/Cu permease